MQSAESGFSLKLKWLSSLCEGCRRKIPLDPTPESDGMCVMHGVSQALQAVALLILEV